MTEHVYMEALANYREAKELRARLRKIEVGDPHYGLSPEGQNQLQVLKKLRGNSMSSDDLWARASEIIEDIGIAVEEHPDLEDKCEELQQLLIALEYYLVEPK